MELGSKIGDLLIKTNWLDNRLIKSTEKQENWSVQWKKKKKSFNSSKRTWGFPCIMDSTKPSSSETANCVLKIYMSFNWMKFYSHHEKLYHHGMQMITPLPHSIQFSQKIVYNYDVGHNELFFKWKSSSWRHNLFVQIHFPSINLSTRNKDKQTLPDSSRVHEL